MRFDFKNLDPTILIDRWSAGKADVLVLDGRSKLGELAATAIANQIRTVSQSKGKIRIVFAAAPSQSDMLECLIRMPGIPWDQVTAFHMDDYIGLPAETPQRFANWLDKHLFALVPFEKVYRIAASGNAEAICSDYSEKLAEAPIDIVCLGIGVNGHIAFNDPPVADFNDPLSVKVVELDSTCRQQQVDDDCFNVIEDVPTHAVTLTIPRLMAADSLFCVVPGKHKRAATAAALMGPISTMCPASILTTHPHCMVFLDREANPHGQ